MSVEEENNCSCRKEHNKPKEEEKITTADCCSSTDSTKEKILENNSTSSTEPICDEILKTFEGTDKLPIELTKMFKPLVCDLCCVKLESEISSTAHYKGKPHKKRVNYYLNEHSLPSNSCKKAKFGFKSVCEICDISLSSEVMAEQHFSGKNHLKMVKKLSKDEGLAPKKVAPLESELYCHLCNVTVSSFEHLDAHKKGVKHLKKLKSDCEETSLLIDFSLFKTPSGCYYCPKCNVNANSSEQFRHHIEGKIHNKKITESECSNQI